MAVINDLKTWQEYCNISLTIRRDWREKVNIPNEYQALFSRTLTIKDLSHDLVVMLLCSCAKDITGVYDIDKDNQKTIDLIVQYLRGDEEFLKVNPSYSFKKGLLLHGPVGSGKTALFKALAKLLACISFYNPSSEFHESVMPGRFKIISANEIVRRFSIDGNLIFMRDHKELISETICLDDMGSEPIAAHFGQKTNIIAEIIQERYEKKSLTHISTNLSVSAIKEAYGLRVYDRMREMLNDIPLTGNSRRK